MKKHPPIVVFDSGFGGISVLKRLVSVMPYENFLYYGDSANAPYGPRPQDEICRLTLSAIERLAAQNPKAIVIACNTATAAALEALQNRYSNLPVIGICPTLEQAVRTGRRVVVLATEGTLRSRSFQNPLQRLDTDAEIFPVAAPQLVTYVENMMKDRESALLSMRELLRPFQQTRIDSVVLGCTHFPFAADVIQEALGYPVSFFDASREVAQRTRQALQQLQSSNPIGTPGTVDFFSSSENPQLLKFAEFLFSATLPTDYSAGERSQRVC